MAWDQLSINRPHLVYIILGGFTSVFMLVSLFIKEKLYIGEATVATICGVIFGPHAANLINPLEWGNTDQITLEFSRIVLVVQCFAVGVELPKAYMERHWKSVVFLLVPVMTFGWLVTSLFIYWMIVPLTWLESLLVAACVTATDPVLASSVVGKGKFAKRVPKHLRDLLSAESGCNDGMAFPFVYLSLYLLKYNLEARHVVFHWTCFTILYECIFGAFYGVMIGYIGRHAIRLAERKGVIDRESFLVFYFVLALFCAGSGSLLGMDDLLIGFAAGVGFSNDGWFTEKTEESHVSNVIDLLINLAYFVYFGTIIPWDQYNSPAHGLSPWRLVVIALFVIFFRRIPAMLAFKPFIPDIKSWREAMFAGHFGPIGVGAIFVAILARAELETESTTPLARLPSPNTHDYNLIYLVWPVVTFLVISSILVHGSSIAVFTLGKRINTLTITLSYTQDNEKGPAWMTRLPRISSQSKSMSRRSSSSMDDLDKLDIPPGQLPPIGIPKLLLRRQKEEESEKPSSRSSSLKPSRRRRRKDREHGMGGPISQSAIAPARRSEPLLTQQESGSDTLFEKSGEPSPESTQDHIRDQSLSSSPEREEAGAERQSRKDTERGRSSRSQSRNRPADVEAFEEGDKLIVEDEEGNVISTTDVHGRSLEDKTKIIEEARKKAAEDQSFAKHKQESHPEDTGGEELAKEASNTVEHPSSSFRRRLSQWKGFGKHKDDHPDEQAESSRQTDGKPKRGAAHAYQFGNTIIVEDEDGEVIKKYTLPGSEKSGDRKRTYGQTEVKQGLQRMGTWVGIGRQDMSQASDALPPMFSDQPTEKTRKDDLKPVDKEEGRNSSDKPDRAPKQEDNENSDDDGLRMTISRTERYGLTGRQKSYGDDRDIELGSGRRMSTKDFLRQMQQLDPKSKIREIDESDAPEDLKQAVRKAAKSEKEESGADDTSERPKPTRFETSSAISGPAAKRPEAERSQSERLVSAGHFPQLQENQIERTSTADALESNDEVVEEIPTHDIQTALARHGRGQTAADVRRRRLASIRSDDEEEARQGAGDEGETAAEKRRRLAALGLGAQEDEESSSESDDEQPRRRRHAVQEPHVAGSSNLPSQVQARRVQWGGESGRERMKERLEQGGGNDGSPGAVPAAVGKKVRGMFKNR